MEGNYTESELQAYSRLILCIEELDDMNSNCPIDTRLFICWEECTNDYIICGKRQDTDKTNFVPFSFHAEKRDVVYDFITCMIDCNKVNITLYNFNNTYDKDYTELNYEFFESLMDGNYEFFGIDKMDLKRSKISKYLRLLKHTYNLAA